MNQDKSKNIWCKNQQPLDSGAIGCLSEGRIIPCPYKDEKEAASSKYICTNYILSTKYNTK